jgi:putative sigma-54 modulation protein
MKITFSARHFEASEKLQTFTAEEIRRLKKYFDGVLNVEVVLEENHTLKVAEIRVNMLGKLLPAKVEGTDFYKIIPTAVDKIEKQIRSTKSKAFGR